MSSLLLYLHIFPDLEVFVGDIMRTVVAKRTLVSGNMNVENVVVTTRYCLVRTNRMRPP